MKVLIVKVKEFVIVVVPISIRAQQFGVVSGKAVGASFLSWVQSTVVVQAEALGVCQWARW